MKRKVTILVALWQAGRFVEAKIRNLRKQTAFDQCNIVLLNCRNLENEALLYADFLAENDNVTEIRYDKHVNLYPTWNDGIKSTDSEFIMNSNVDDMLHPRYVEICSQWLQDNPEYACVSTAVLTTQEPNQEYPNWNWKGRMPFHPYPLSTAGPCPMWRRNLHEKYGYFGDYRVIGDARMWEAWKDGGEKFGLIEGDLVLYYSWGGSLERRTNGKGIPFRTLDIREDEDQSSKSKS